MSLSIGKQTSFLAMNTSNSQATKSFKQGFIKRGTQHTYMNMKHSQHIACVCVMTYQSHEYDDDGSCGLWRDRNRSLIGRHGLGAFHPSWCSGSCWRRAMVTAPEGTFMCGWWTQALPLGDPTTATTATVTLWWCGNCELALRSLRLRSHEWWWWWWWWGLGKLKLQIRYSEKPGSSFI